MALMRASTGERAAASCRCACALARTYCMRSHHSAPRAGTTAAAMGGNAMIASTKLSGGAQRGASCKACGAGNRHAAGMQKATHLPWSAA